MVQAFIVHDKKLRIMKVHILFYEQHVISMPYTVYTILLCRLFHYTSKASCTHIDFLFFNFFLLF